MGFAGSGWKSEPLVNVLRSFVNPLVQSARLNQPQASKVRKVDSNVN
jgi:hypothetical protein